MSDPVLDRAPQSTSGEDSVRKYLKGKESNDLVFAVTGRLGSGCTRVASALSEQLRGAGFRPTQITLSDRIAALAGVERGSDHLVVTTGNLQKAGDDLRRRHGSSIVAGLAISAVHDKRQIDPARGTTAFILDSLKNPEEVEVLRTVYGSSFYLIGVLANEETRFERLKLKYKKEECDAQEKERRIRMLMADDEAGAEDHEQQVRKTVQLSDFFVENEGEDLGTHLRRFIDAVTRVKIVRPTVDEKGMHAAWAAALKSSCLSRQVGAAILTDAGLLLAVGTNDPPAPGGGVYGAGHDGPDYRCFNFPAGNGFCRNDKVKSEIYTDVYRAMKADGLLSSTATPEQIRRAVGSTRVKDLIEFSRAVHAEMDALLSLARNGVPLPKRSMLFCTTYPCHSCARHIVAAGIQTVVYIEPYPKSMALDLHGDAIASVAVPPSAAIGVPQNTSPEKVVFRLFTGVAPRAYSALFEKRGEVKDRRTGKLVTLRSQSPSHVIPMLTGSFLDLEKNVAETVSSLLDKGGSDVR